MAEQVPNLYKKVISCCPKHYFLIAKKSERDIKMQSFKCISDNWSTKIVQFTLFMNLQSVNFTRQER